MALVRDNVGCGFAQGEEVGADVLYFSHCTWAEEMILVSVRMITYMSHGGRVEGVRVIVVALGCDVGGDERCKDGGHLLVMVAEYLLEGLIVPPCGRMIAVHVGVIDGGCMELEGFSRSWVSCMMERRKGAQSRSC